MTERRRVGFTGSRRGITDAQRSSLREVLGGLWPLELHHGDCVGADASAHELGDRAGNSAVVHPPREDKLRAFCSAGAQGYDSVTILAPREYLQRDNDIVVSAEELVATPCEVTGERRQSGTWTTVRYARRKGVTVTIIRPDGSITVEPGVCVKQHDEEG